MRIVLEELRKIFRPIMILLTLISFVISCLLPFQSNISGFLDDSYKFNYDYTYSMELINRYGKTLEPDEFNGILSDYSDLIEQADEYISSKHPETLTDWEFARKYYNVDYVLRLNPDKDFSSDYEASAEEYDNYTAAQNIVYELFDKAECDYLSKKILTIYDIIICYNENYSSEMSNIVPIRVINTLNLFEWVIVFMIISVALVVSPMLATDNLGKLSSLQYHTYTGRNILIYQFVATIITAFITCIAFMTILVLLYISTGISTFWNSPVKSFMTLPDWQYYAFDFTFGQAVLLMTGLCTAFCIGFSMIIFFLSKISSNYISLIIKVVPVTIAACFTGYNILKKKAFFRNYDSINHKWLDTYNTTVIFATVIILIIGTDLVLYTIWREKNVEIQE